MSLRALIDPASERSFVTQQVVSQLNLNSKKVNISITGVGASNTTVAHKEVFSFLKSSKNKQFCLNFSALVLNELTRCLPNRKIDCKDWHHLKGLELADPQFAHPSRIDCILGADVYPTIILDGLVRGPLGAPVAHKSVFGWILTGSSSIVNVSKTVRGFHIFTQPSLSDTLVKFWEIEEFPIKTLLTSSEKYCEEQFTNTHL